MKTQLRKIDFTSNENEVIEIINKNDEVFSENFSKLLKENRSIVDIELIVDQNDCVYDYRLWDTYHKLGQNYTYGNGWTNWLMEYELYCPDELKEKFSELIS